jgi:crotonobetaine/carnitine-CoA ligase
MKAFTDLRPTFPDRQHWSVPWILRHRANTHGDAIYLDVPSTGERYTYRETLAQATAVGSGLTLAGGVRGDRVVVMLPNCSELVFGWLGSGLFGMVDVPINTDYRGAFLEHQVRTTAPRFAVLAPEYAERFVEIGDAADTIEVYYLTGSSQERATASSVLSMAGRRVLPFESLLASQPVAVPEVAAHELASVLFTSGTTGLSKGIMMPNAQLCFFADSCVSLTRLSDVDTYMAVGPLFHGNSRFMAALPALLVGARFVMREKLSAHSWIDWARDSQVTVTNLVGVMMDFIWKTPARPDDSENDLRCILAAPVASEIEQGFHQRFGLEAFVEVFGLTEISVPIMTPYGQRRPKGSCGLLVSDFFEIRLVDEFDREVAVGEMGELTIRSKEPWTVSSGYYGMPEKTLEAFRNLWFHTGDGLRRDADGWYYFVDRLKDTIRRRGENISSYEIEQAVLRYEGVKECAAVAVPASFAAGEDEVMVVAVVADGVTRGDVYAWCIKHLPRFALPRYIRLADQLPKTPSGKLRKVELRAITPGAEDVVEPERQPSRTGRPVPDRREDLSERSAVQS